MNTFMSELKKANNYTLTENGGLAHKELDDKVYEMFAEAGAYRKRSDDDCILLFKNAYEENPTLAMKCLFYVRDARGGLGERRFFRVCFKWLAKKHPEAALRVLEYLPVYGRYDDWIYALVDTPLEGNMLALIKYQLDLDMQSETPSLLAKWLPSLNCSSVESKRLANIVRNYLHMTPKQYRKMLSTLREKINIVERLMSANRWDEIKFDALPSKAGLIYKNAFARRDIIAEKYEKFAKDENTKVNADTLYPYEIVNKAIVGDREPSYYRWLSDYENYAKLSDTDRAMLEKYWNNQKDYLNGKPCKMICVVDTSASMRGSQASAPINVAISLGMYCAERLGGPFKDHFISFSANPHLVHIEGIDFVDKVRRIYQSNICENTDLRRVFKMLKRISKKANPEDRPDTVVILSDMEIDAAMDGYPADPEAEAKTMMENMREEWAAEGLEMPKLVYWNVESRNRNAFLDDGPNITYVSGASPSIFEAVLSGKTGKEMMYDVLNSERYKAIS